MPTASSAPEPVTPARTERRRIWLVLLVLSATVVLAAVALRRKLSDDAGTGPGAGAESAELAGARPGETRPAPPELHADPSVQIFSPADGSSVRSARVGVQGRARGLQAIWINEERTAVGPDGAFEAQVDLAHGEGEIRVTAPSEGGSQRELALVRVLVDLEDPLIQLETLPGIQIDDPPFARLVGAGPAVIAGRVVDPWPGRPARIALDGEPVLMQADGAFQIDVALDHDGPRVIALEARDDAGNVCRQRLVVVRDTEPPVLTVDSSAVGEGLGAGDAVLIRGRVADLHPGRVLLDGVPISLDRDGEFERDVVLEKERTVLRFVGEDLMGNRSEEVVIELQR